MLTLVRAGRSFPAARRPSDAARVLRRMDGGIVLGRSRAVDAPENPHVAGGASTPGYLVLGRFTLGRRARGDPDLHHAAAASARRLDRLACRDRPREEPRRTLYRGFLPLGR